MEKEIEKTIKIPNRLDDLVAISRDVFDWLDGLDISEDAKYAGRLAVEECASNTIKYGYDDQDAHVITLTIGVDDKHLYMVFEDDGHAFDPTARPPMDLDDTLESMPAGGLGIELLQRLSDKMEYQRNGNINRLSMSFSRFDPELD